MNRENGIYIAQCGFCHQGHLQFMRCHSCTTVVAVCDECELVWLDISAVKANPQVPATVAFPKCPACHSKQPYWSRVSRAEIERTSLSRFAIISDESSESERRPRRQDD
jgi:hypothetical protein